jgi:hypothetical protein
VLVVAVAMVAMVVFVAFAVDVGMLYNERRQDQAAADAAALGGAISLAAGVTAATEAAAAVARSDLDTTYTDTQWKALWAACQDPGHLRFTGKVLGQSTQCLSVSTRGELRVRLPDQVVETAFARVVGIETVTTNALAVAGARAGGGGLLPFAILVTAVDGNQLCLRTATNGQAVPPCTGSSSGNFGALEVPQYGNDQMGTQNIPCNINKSDQLAVNIAVGIDHLVLPWQGTDVLDSCTKPFGPTMLNTFQGISNGLFEGLIEGVTVAGTTFPGRMTTGSNPKRTLREGSTNWNVDDRPLWEYIPTGKGAGVPASCRRETFAALAAASRTANLTTCLSDWRTTGPRGVLFDLDADRDDVPDILGSARFGFAPQFVENSFPNGNGYLRVKNHRGVFLQGMWFGCNGNGCAVAYHPGEGTGVVTIPHGKAIDQVSGFLLANGMLPESIIENGAGGSLGPYSISLTR